LLASYINIYIKPQVRLDDTVGIYFLILTRAAEGKDITTSPYAPYYILTVDVKHTAGLSSES
jgi:hypothetical protein